MKYPFLLFFLVAAISILVGCSTTKTHIDLKTSAPASVLLVSKSSFPQNWIITPCEPTCYRREGELYAMRDFYNSSVPGGVIQEVYRLKNGSEAQAKYTDIYDVDLKYLNSDVDIYKSTIADKYSVKCGEDIVPICSSLGLYGNYVVYFYFALNENGIQKKDIGNILASQEERINDQLLR